MLLSLTIRQFALIDAVHLELDGGMTVFTGETGAGKSMLGGALSAVFGARASSDWVRHGADRAEITAVWQGGSAALAALLHEAGIESEEELILRRLISAEGRSRAFINGVPVPLKTLQQVGAICLDMHAQHDHHLLMQDRVQLQLLDARLTPDLHADVAQAFSAWRQLGDRLTYLHAEQGESEQQAVWMREELARLEAIDVTPDLAESLQTDVDAGRHHAQIRQAAAEVLDLLDEAEPSVRSIIARTTHLLEPVSGYHAGLHNAHALIEQIDALIGEATPALSDALDRAFDEQALQQCEQRLMALHEAMRRHRCDESGLLDLMDQWRERLAGLDTADWDEAALQRQLAEAAARYRDCASALSEARGESADQIVSELHPYLEKLALKGMQVSFVVDAETEEAAWRANGWDRVTMQVISNPGEPWRDLSAVASGGELSRLVLALKGCGALKEMPELVVFDEIDTGIGGETAWCVGELLAQMGRERQVLVISHLPQVAACADHHVAIGKSEREGRTVTELHLIAADDRESEVARMLGGGETQSLRHAAEMLQRGRAMT